MNRRKFITTAAAVSMLPSVAASTEKEVVKTVTEEFFTIECCTHKNGSNLPYKTHKQFKSPKLASIEDAVQYVFEHAKGFDLTKVSVSYNILYNKNNRLIQAGHYTFRDKDTFAMTYEQGRWWSVSGWHGNPPYTDYYAVESA